MSMTFDIRFGPVGPIIRGEYDQCVLRDSQSVESCENLAHQPIDMAHEISVVFDF